MQESVAVVPLVLLAALLHASWNALVRAGGDRLSLLAGVNFTGVLVGACLIPFLPVPEPGAWPYLALSVAFHTGYYFYLLRAYDRGELIQVYPLARGSAPLLIVAGGYLFAGEVLSAWGLCGVVLASIGIISLSFEHGAPWRRCSAVAPALVTSVFIAAYSVTDGLGGRAAGSVLAYICWLSFLDGWPIALYTLHRRRHRLRLFLLGNWGYCVAGGLFSMSAYGLVIYAMSLGAMGMVSALRETSVIMAAVIGVLFLGERFTAVRGVAVVLVACGVVLMRAAG